MHVTARNSSIPRFTAHVAAVVTVMAGLVFVAAPANAATVSGTINGVTYTADDTNTGAGATAMDYDPASGPTVVIPPTVSLGGTEYAVRTIGAGAFESNGLTHVTIGNSVTSIGDFAFYGNTLTNVTIPHDVTTIGNTAFARNNLTHVTIGNGVTTIGVGAFANNNLTNVIIGNSVTTVGNYAFDENPGLRAVRFLGAAPAVTLAGFNESFDTGNGPLVLHFPASQDGYTTPTWQEYDTMAGLAPTITGTPREGYTLTAPTDPIIPAGAVPTTYTFQWYANGIRITGANAARLKLGKAQAGRRITVAITSTSPGPDTETKTSAATPFVSSPYARLVLSTRTVKRGHNFSVVATGLKSSQRYAVWLGGVKAYTGKADSRGVVYRTAKFPSSVKLGTRTVRVSGYNSSGHRTYTIHTSVNYVR